MKILYLSSFWCIDIDIFVRVHSVLLCTLRKKTKRKFSNEICTKKFVGLNFLDKPYFKDLLLLQVKPSAYTKM